MNDSRPDSPEWIKAQFHGNAGEMAIADWFQQRGFDVTKVLAPASGYDLLLCARAEVKTDLAALRSGNVVIEIGCAGKPSGLSITQATFWIIIVGDEAFIAPTDRLRTLIEDERFREVDGGDGCKARLVLVPLAELRSQSFVRHISLTEQEAA